MTEPADPFATTDAAALVAAIEQAAERFARDRIEEADASALAREVLEHATHARAKVRQAVAQAAVDLPEDAFEEAIGILLRDDNQYVKRAATRSFDERSRRRRERRAHEESSAGVRALRARIAEDHTEAAARAADRLSDLTLTEFIERFLHELLKVATPLQNTLRELRDDARRTAGEGLASRADEALGTLDVLVQITKATRAHAQAKEPKLRDEALRPVVDEHVALLVARVDEARRARLRVTVDVSDGLAAEIDRGMFGQALTNVLQNAVEAYDANGDGPIHVSVTGGRRSADTLVVLTVEDRGRGIRAEEIEHIGEAFVSSKGRGRGLGVLNVKRMIETVHGGRVEVESEVGRGTRVTVVVPRRQ